MRHGDLQVTMANMTLYLPGLQEESALFVDNLSWQYNGQALPAPGKPSRSHFTGGLSKHHVPSMEHVQQMNRSHTSDACRSVWDCAASSNICKRQRGPAY